MNKNQPYTRADKVTAFLSRIEITGPNECWLWQGGTYNCGYGVYGWRGKMRAANRIMWEIANGQNAPDEKDVLHACDVRLCVNPSQRLESYGTTSASSLCASGTCATGAGRQPSSACYPPFTATPSALPTMYTPLPHEHRRNDENDLQPEPDRRSERHRNRCDEPQLRQALHGCPARAEGTRAPRAAPRRVEQERSRVSASVPPTPVSICCPELEGDVDFERGRQFGRLYRSEGRDYTKPYPSNPYHESDPRHAIYEAGYEEGFNGR